MKLTGRLASRIGIAGVRRSYAGRATAESCGSHGCRGIGAPGVRTFPRLFAPTLTAVLLGLLLSVPGSALATTGHGFAGSFGGHGLEDGQFSRRSPVGVGVGLSGDVYAVDSGEDEGGAVHWRVERFDSGGTFVSAFPVNSAAFAAARLAAVDTSAGGGVYVGALSLETYTPAVAKYSLAGALEYTLNPGSATSLSGGPVAVDPSNGTVYAAATSNETFLPVIDSFDQKTGALIASFGGETGSPDGGFQCPSGLTVDSTHHIYVLDGCKARVDKYSSAGEFEATVDSGSRGAPQAVASNPETGEIYVSENGPSGLQVTNFAAGGTSAVTTFPVTADEGPNGLAVGPDGTVYTGDSTNAVIDRFTAFEAPTVTTGAAEEVQRTTATLNGTVDAESIATEYHYEYGLDNTYGNTTASVSAGSGSTAEAAPAAITRLVPNTTYHYRLVGRNASGSIAGEDRELTTVAAPPAVDGSPAFVTTITPTGARIHGTVNPDHSPTTFKIEYGTTTAYGSSAPEAGAEVGEQSADTPVATTLSGLKPGTEYHYRVSAENGIEEAQIGADGTFVTAPGAPAGANGLTTAKATLTGTIDPHGSATTYHFNYGPSSEYGVSTPEREGGSGEGDQEVSAAVTGLSPGTTYHVRVVAVTNGVSRAGTDGTFTTAPAPSAEVTDPTAVTSGSATLNGTVDTNGLAGSYHFELSALDGSYTANTGEQAVSGAQAVVASVGGLPAGETFHARIVVASNEATAYSNHATFSTPALPTGGFPTPPAPAGVYGCTAPRLNPVNGKIKPGSTITVTGSDLGMNGSVLLGEETLNPTGWSSTGFTIQAPGDAVGTLGLTVNCGVASNTVAVVTSGSPVNAFTVTKKSVKGQTATFTVELPGPGALQTSGSRTKGTAGKVTAAETQTVKVTLSKAGAKALKKAKKRISVKVALRFTPAGGSTASQTATVTFTRKGGK